MVPSEALRDFSAYSRHEAGHPKKAFLSYEPRRQRAPAHACAPLPDPHCGRGHARRREGRHPRCRELAHHWALYRKLQTDLCLRASRNIAVRQTPAGLRRRIIR
jgi:hypothetical protein